MDTVDDEVLMRFNQRDTTALEIIYQTLFPELKCYTLILYRDTDVNPCDAIHDAFISVWEHKHQKFEKLINLKAYLYVILKNHFRDYVRKKQLIRQKSQQYSNEQFVLDVAQSEIFSLLPEALNLLPQECAKVIEYLIEGWEIKEIAHQLNKKESTVYNQRREAIKILKKKLDKDSFLIINALINL